MVEKTKSAFLFAKNQLLPSFALFFLLSNDNLSCDSSTDSESPWQEDDDEDEEDEEVRERPSLVPQ